MPLLNSRYRPPWYLRSAHVQTVYPTLHRTVRMDNPPVRERIDTPDGDFLDLDRFYRGCGRVAVLSHGLEGNSRRAYMLGMARALLRRRWDVVAWNYRGCSGEPNQRPRFYHSGATDDLDTVVQHVLRGGLYQRLALVGFSLGGNLTLKYLGEGGTRLDGRVGRSVVFSVPCDLASSAMRMARWHNRLYMRRFLRMLREKIRAKNALFPEITDDGYETIRDFRAFDDRYTAPLHGFADARDYWLRCSSRPLLARITVPTLLVNALDDPFLAADCFPMEEATANPQLFMETPRWGGHVGFIAWNGENEYWSETRAADFLEDV